MNAYIEMKILKESTIADHFDDYEQENIERCPDCGSSIFRIYDEPVKEGTYEQTICAVCGHRMGGWLNDFESDEGVDGRICAKCGDSLERRRDTLSRYKGDKEKDDTYEIEDDNDDYCIDRKCTDRDRTIPFRKATVEEIKKIDDICMDIIEYMERKYGNLAIDEIYMVLQNLVRSFEDFTESAYGKAIKVIRNDDVTDDDYDDVMYA